MNGTKHIIKKELDRVFHDKKLMMSLFIMPVVLIVIIYSLIGYLQNNMTKDIEKHQSIVIIENQPKGLKEIIDTTKYKAKIEYRDNDKEDKKIKNKILTGDIDTLIVFDKEFENKIKAYKDGDTIPEVKTYYNPSEDYSSKAREEFVNIVLNPYKEKLLAERIGNLEQLKIFDIDVDKDSSIIMDNKKASGKMLGMILPYLITFMLFAGAMGLGVDAITGEKERGTLASMLVSPLKRREIVAGKVFSLTLLSCISALIYAGSMVLAMPIMLKSMAGEGGMEGFVVKFTAVQIIEMFAIMITLVVLYVTIIVLVAVLARTAKEANTYVTPIYIIVMILGMLTMFSGNTEVSTGMYIVPIYGSAVALQSIFTGILTLPQFLMAIMGNVLVSGIFGFLVTKAFNSEKIMFNA